MHASKGRRVGVKIRGGVKENEAGRACSWPHNVILSVTGLQHMTGICCLPIKFWHCDAFYNQFGFLEAKQH